MGECNGCGVQVLLVLTFVSTSMLGSAEGTNWDRSCSSCFEVFASEFDESKLACNARDYSSAIQCQCKFQVLDLAACVATNTNEKHFDLVVTEIVSNDDANKYTAECRDALEKHGPCKLEDIKDSGFKITPSEIALTAFGVAFEMISAYQMVQICLEFFLFIASTLES